MIEALIEEFLTYQVNMDIYSASTAAAVRSDFRGFIRFLTRDGIAPHVDAFTSRNVGRYLAAEKPRVKGTTVKRWWKSFNAVGHWGANNGYLDRNPMDGVRIGRVATVRREFIFDVGQASCFLKVRAVTGLLPEVDSAMRHLQLFGGFRRSELLRLQWEHVDLDLQQISVYDSKGTRRKGHPKNLDRVIPICPPLRQALVSLKRVTYPTSDEPVLFVKQGCHLSKDAFYKAFSAVRVAMGLNEDFVPHCLRHNLAGSLVGVGATLADVAYLLGHASTSPGSRPSVTERYITSSVGRVRSFLDRYAEWVSNEHPQSVDQEHIGGIPGGTEARPSGGERRVMQTAGLYSSSYGSLPPEQLAEAVALWSVMRPGESPANSAEFSTFVGHLASRIGFGSRQ